jgi:hypothetical protein
MVKIGRKISLLRSAGHGHAGRLIPCESTAVTAALTGRSPAGKRIADVYLWIANRAYGNSIQRLCARAELFCDSRQSPIFNSHRHVAQWESASLTRKRSAVQSCPCLPVFDI